MGKASCGKVASGAAAALSSSWGFGLQKRPNPTFAPWPVVFWRFSVVGDGSLTCFGRWGREILRAAPGKASPTPHPGHIAGARGTNRQLGASCWRVSAAGDGCPHAQPSRRHPQLRSRHNGHPRGAFQQLGDGKSCVRTWVIRPQPLARATNRVPVAHSGSWKRVAN